MKFEKVSFTAFYNDMGKCFEEISNEEIQSAYVSIQKPERKTKYSAGYDFVSPISTILEPGRKITIPSGIKCFFSDSDAGFWFLAMFDRSSIGIRYDTQMPNSVGIIDADYYNNPCNEGDIMIPLKNNGCEDLVIKAGDRICQGIFLIYGITTDDHAKGKRIGGVGSTNGR